MRFDLFTVEPELCRGPIEHSMLGRGKRSGAIEVTVHDLHDWGEGRHRTVDDTPCGGGSGMVIRVDVVDRALQETGAQAGHVVLLDPGAPRFVQADAQRLATMDHLTLLCGHYEGVDDRVRQHLVDEVFSIGDMILTGGELPALLMLDAIARLVPGVLGNPDSLLGESYQDGLLAPPSFTRPTDWRGWTVPEVLLSGHHKRISQWRQEQARARTLALRPELLDEDERE